METNRQKKIAGVLQKDLAEVLQHAARDGMKGVIISVTRVHVTTDLSLAKVYISIRHPKNHKFNIASANLKNFAGLIL